MLLIFCQQTQGSQRFPALLLFVAQKSFFFFFFFFPGTPMGPYICISRDLEPNHFKS